MQIIKLITPFRVLLILNLVLFFYVYQLTEPHSDRIKFIWIAIIIQLIIIGIDYLLIRIVRLKYTIITELFLLFLTLIYWLNHFYK